MWFLHPRYHPEIIGDILKTCANNKCVYLNENNNDNKNEAENENRSSRYDINRPRRRHGHTYVLSKT